MKPCRLMNFVGCSTTTGWIFSVHPSWENGKSKKTDESHRSPNHAATSRTALRLLNPPERSSLGCARIDRTAILSICRLSVWERQTGEKERKTGYGNRKGGSAIPHCLRGVHGLMYGPLLETYQSPTDSP